MQNLITCFNISSTGNSTIIGRLSFSMAYILLTITVAFSSGCAVHYYDIENNVEHIWGIGHMAMKPSPANEGVIAVGRRTDVIGLSIAKVQDQFDVTFGWNAKQRIDILKEDARLSLAWPQGSFYNARVGANFLQAGSACGTTTTKEASP